MRTKKIISRSEVDTISFAYEMVDIVKPGNVIALIGEIGCGKTYFIRAFCRKLGINHVTSPTFHIVNTYIKDDVKIYHFDFYKLIAEQELTDIGFDDYMNDKKAIKLIEWADMFPDLMPSRRYEVIFEVMKDFTRSISMQKYGR